MWYNEMKERERGGSSGILGNILAYFLAELKTFTSNGR
jgi:hypothetical protein